MRSFVIRYAGRRGLDSVSRIRGGNAPTIAMGYNEANSGGLFCVLGEYASAMTDDNDSKGCAGYIGCTIRIA